MARIRLDQWREYVLIQYSRYVVEFSMMDQCVFITQKVVINLWAQSSSLLFPGFRPVELQILDNKTELLTRLLTY